MNNYSLFMERSDMESPGEYLRREREIRGVSLKDISNATKIRVGLLTAIEKNDFDALPAAPFVKGFIQAYCKYLGLDTHDALLRYEAYMRSLAEKETAAKQESEAGGQKLGYASPRLSFPMIGTILVALLVIIGGIYSVSKLKKQPPSIAPDSSHAQAQLESKGETKLEGTPLPKERQDSGVSAGIPGAPLKEENKVMKPVPAGKAASAGLGRGGELTLIIEAAKPSWIKVQIDDKDPFEASLRQGEKVKWNANLGFSLLIGNAGGVNVIFNGNPLGRLGDEGKVVKLVLPKERPRTPDSRPQTSDTKPQPPNE